MAVEFWYVNFNKFIYLIFMLVPSRSFQRQSNLMLSNAFFAGNEAYRSFFTRDAIMLLKTLYGWLRRLIGR